MQSAINLALVLLAFLAISTAVARASLGILVELYRQEWHSDVYRSVHSKDPSLLLEDEKQYKMAMEDRRQLLSELNWYCKVMQLSCILLVLVLFVLKVFN